MKKITLLIAFLAINVSFAQFNESAPWIKNLKKYISPQEMQQRKQQPQLFTFYEVQEAFNTYWETHDKNKKGSGYKPFKRWEYQVESEVNVNGYLPTAQDKWNAWEAKNNFSTASKSVLADQSNWQPVGPFTTVGTGSWSTGQARVNVVLVDPNNAANSTNIWYVGTPAGGIWKSTDNGSSWIPLTDKLPQIGVSGIAVDYNDSDTIYIATGDDDAGDSQSVGVWKSTDGGTTWNATGLNPGNSPTSMNDIYMHPTNSNVLWVATNNGVYKTTDAGVNWNQTLAGDIKDIKLRPGNPNFIYVVTSNKFYKSTNSGTTFSQVSTGLPANSGRLVIDVTPANSGYVYVLSVKTDWTIQGLYRSTNSGNSFTARNTTTDILESTQGWYDLALGVSDVNANQVYVGCLNIWRSNNGGTNFTKINNWSAPLGSAYTHADIHFLRAYNGIMYAGTDGGVYSSNDNGATFENHTFGIQASQLYKIAVSTTNVNKMVGGLQDNGGHAFNSTTGQSRNYYGADGMDTAVDPTNENIFYGFIQSGGGPYISTDAGATLSGSVTKPENGNWVTPMAINSVGKLYGGYEKLFRLDGTTWVELADFNAFTTDRCDLLEIAPSDDTIMYAVVDNVLKRSTNSGVTFTNIETFGSDVKGIGVHQTNPNIVWITTSGVGRGVFKTTNGLAGATFNNVTSNLPTAGVGEYFTDIVHQANHTDNPVFLATGLGVYRLDDTSINWEPFFVNLPNTQVTDLEINIIDESITAATYGRGVWRSSIPVQMVANDVKMITINNPTSVNINCSTNVLPEITVKNNGLNTINAIAVNYTVDGGVTSTYNWSGSLASTLETTFTLPQLNLSRALHVLNVETIIAGDANAGNNTFSVDFYTNDSSAVNVVNTFEAPSDILITNSTWEQGVPTGANLSASASGTQVYATNLSGNYPNNANAYLTSQCYDLTQIVNPILHFDMAFDIEENWDYAYVEYTLDSGATWTTLGSKNSMPLWYNSDATANGIPGAQWTGEAANVHASGGTNGTMREYSYDFAGNVGIGETDLTGATNILFRIALKSDGLVVKEGLIIDDFVITGTPLAIEDYTTHNLVIYPNPSKGIFNIKFQNIRNEVQLSVLDVFGKKVYTTKINTLLYQLNLNNLATGVYFLNINDVHQQTTKKIIIK